MSAELDANDRDTLVLRYLDDRNLREVGAELGISEDAARKRVDRALERLRTVLEHRSVFATTVLLATALLSSVVAVLSATALPRSCARRTPDGRRDSSCEGREGRHKTS